MREKLEKKKEFPGFNLITSNINFRDGTCSSANKMFYLSNCDPENDDFRELERFVFWMIEFFKKKELIMLKYSEKIIV